MNRRSYRLLGLGLGLHGGAAGDRLIVLGDAGGALGHGQVGAVGVHGGIISGDIGGLHRAAARNGHVFRRAVHSGDGRTRAYGETGAGSGLLHGYAGRLCLAGQGHLGALSGNGHLAGPNRSSQGQHGLRPGHIHSFHHGGTAYGQAGILPSHGSLGYLGASDAGTTAVHHQSVHIAGHRDVVRHHQYHAGGVAHGGPTGVGIVRDGLVQQGHDRGAVDGLPRGQHAAAHTADKTPVS